MKFLVDEMPNFPDDCPFCRAYWEDEVYVPYCAINTSEDNIVDCKYFKTHNDDDCRLLKVKEDEKRVKGTWGIKLKRLDLSNIANTTFQYSCSLCKSISDNAAPYCPGCGAKMEVEDEN